jgi:type IV pilus assembly protein PilM
MFQLPTLSLDLSLGRRRSAPDVVGLDIQPGLIAAVKARTADRSILAERAALHPLNPDTVREGEVFDVDALTEALRELFDDAALGKRVRLGIANQRTVMRTLELPPVSDRKELAAAVRFQAEDQIPMPLDSAVLDFHPLGVFDSPSGPRQRVVVVAAQRDMVERLLAAVRGAGLAPEGVDLSAFALIRALYDPSEAGAGRVLYVNVDGLTNLAIAEGTVCRFTRVVGGGLETMAADLAARRGIPLLQARALLGTVDPREPQDAFQREDEHVEELPDTEPPAAAEAAVQSSSASDFDPDADEAVPQVPLTREEHEAREIAMGYREALAIAQPAVSDLAAVAGETGPQVPESDADIRSVLEDGVRQITGEIRNSLDFHRTQDQGGEVAFVSLSGAALDLPGFVESLQDALGLEVRGQSVGLLSGEPDGEASTHRLSVAAGLATTEVAQ